MAQPLDRDLIVDAEELNKQATGLLGQARSVLAWKVIEYVGLVLFIAIVPRAMGPELYGGLAAILSFILLLSVAAGLGGTAIFGRYLPKFQADGRTQEIRVIFTQLFCARLLISIVLGFVFFFLLTRALPSASVITGMAGAGALVCFAVSTTCYQVFYGLNDLGRWLSRNALKKILLLATLIAIGGTRSLEAAALAVFATELAFLVLGVYWARSFFALDRSILNISQMYSVFGFGAMFFTANLLTRGVMHGGEFLLLVLTANAAEVAYFSVAFSGAAIFIFMFNQLILMLVPTMTSLHHSGNTTAITAWLSKTLKYLTISSFVLLLSFFAFGEWLIVTVFGEQYFASVANLKILSIGLVFALLFRIGMSLSIARGEPRRALSVTIVMFIVFVVTSLTLIPSMGSYGASLALIMAFGAAAGISCYVFSLGTVVVQARLAELTLFGVGAAAILAIPIIPMFHRGVIALIVFGALIWLNKVVTSDELKHIARLLASRRSAPNSIG